MYSITPGLWHMVCDSKAMMRVYIPEPNWSAVVRGAGVPGVLQVNNNYS